MEDKIKRPALWFFPKEWIWDLELRQCSIAARGLWIDLLCLMHEGEPYGHLTAPLDLVLRVTGLTEAKFSGLLAELETVRVGGKRVAYRTEAGVLYSKRMVRDEEKLEIRRENGRHGGRPRKTPPDSQLPFSPEPDPVTSGVTPKLQEIFDYLAANYPNCTNVDYAYQNWMGLCDRGEVTEAQIPEIQEGFQRYQVSQKWADGYIEAFDKWILGRKWKDRPPMSAEAKAAERTGRKSSEGIDPNAEWVPSWGRNGGSED